jgi:hypothetical protein
VRGDALSKLPEGERAAWRRLWEDAEQTLRKAHDNKKSSK